MPGVTAALTASGCRLTDVQQADTTVDVDLVLKSADGHELGQGGAARASQLFGIIDEQLGKDGPFIMGDSFSAADIYLFMLALWAKPSERDLLQRCRNIARVSEEVRRRPKLRATLEVHGAAQPQG